MSGFSPDRAVGSMSGRLNVYNCDMCNKYIVTVDRAEGVTPFHIACRATPKCKGLMHSAMYRVFPWLRAVGHLQPAFEWYKPSEAEARKFSKATQQHISQGGLMLREIVTAQ